MNAPQKPKQFALIKIDDGIPIPLANSLPRNMFPFKTMKAGQSFAFPANVPADRAYKAATNANRRMKPKVFRVRKLENEIRCWRIA